MHTCGACVHELVHTHTEVRICLSSMMFGRGLYVRTMYLFMYVCVCMCYVCVRARTCMRVNMCVNM